ncbi:MAG: histidinol-phosphate transaminase [Microlunatus sp.]
MALQIRPEAAGLPVYRPGRRPAEISGRPAYKLSSNENPYPPLPGVLAAATAACDELNRYPDLGVTRLTETLAQRLGVDPARLAFGTGSVAVLFHLLNVLGRPGAEVVYAFRTFEAYPIATQLSGATGVPVPLTREYEHDLDAMLAAITPATVAVLLCTPNNPTGPALRQAEVEAFVERVPPEVAVLIDEAYVEFVDHPDAVNGLTLLNRPNVIVLRTFSKAHGLAGLRIGYCVGPAELASVIRAAANPFGVTTIAQAAALASLDAEDALQERVAELVVRRTGLLNDLRELGFEAPDAQGNFVWLPAGPLTQRWAEAFADMGVMVRPYASNTPFDGIRITVGEPPANDLVLEIAARLPVTSGREAERSRRERPRRGVRLCLD